MSSGYQPQPDRPEGQQSHHMQPKYGHQEAQPYAPQAQPQYGQGLQSSFPPPGQPPYGPPPGQPPYGPPPSGYHQYGGQSGPRGGSGLAISALVLGIIALFLCWVPIVNNFAAILAVVGLALGVPALISARRGKRTGSGLAVASVILSGVPPRPEPPVVDVVRRLRGTLVAEGSLYTRAHTAIALSRPGASSIDDEDKAWARALQAALGEDGRGTRSLHVAASGWITTLLDPPTARFPPHRIPRRPPVELLDRSWLADHD